MIRNLLTLIFIVLVSIAPGTLNYCCASTESGLSESIEVYEIAPGDDIKLFPNPAGDHFSLQNTSKVKGIEIISVIGKTVKVFGEITNFDNFYIGDLNTGLYMVRIIDLDGKVLKTIRLQKK